MTYEDLRYPSDIYFRIVRAGATKELRVDLYRALDESEGYKTEEEALQQPISSLVRKLNEKVGGIKNET